MSNRVSCGVCTYSFGYVTGGIGRGTNAANPNPLDGFGLIDLAVKHSLSGVEFPASMLGAPDSDEWAKARDLLTRHDLHIVVDGGLLLKQDVAQLIRAAQALGAKTARVILSGLLCGDRRPMEGKWGEHVRECAKRLQEVEPMARDAGVAIAVENHQDASSEDLLHLCETVDSPCVGVNLDAGNPLAVGEDPVEFAEKIAPFLKNVHLKDYVMVPSDTGYRLIRCALGDGVVDWERLFPIFDENAPNATRSIELGAMQERHVQLFESWWWEHYTARDARTLVGPMRLLATHGLPRDFDGRIPFEKGEPLQAQYDYEMSQFERSVEYLRNLLAES
ncbi:MAG: sugar phosphate isomerase/epimerase [Candidatus Poribacteria bacterium]|nr:sugar phosphate isomerase/epimerase [Candidatus Poribacteria bacterium]